VESRSRLMTDQDHNSQSSSAAAMARARTITATASLAPGRGGGWGPVPSAPPSRTPRRTPSCSRPPPLPARRREPPAEKETIRKEPPSLDPRPQRGALFTLATSAFSRMPCALSMGAAVSSRRNAAAAPPARERGESVRDSGFRGGGRTKKRGLRRDARASRTCPVRRRGGGGRQAGQEDGDGDHGDDGRASHPARPGPADVAGRQHAKGKRRGGGKKMEASLLQKPSALCVLRRRVGFARLVGGSAPRKPGGASRRPRRQVLCSPSVPRSRDGGTPGEHLALRSRTAGLPRRAVAAGAVCGPGLRGGRGLAGPECRERERERERHGACVFARGFLALAASGRAAVPSPR
jgi:hypothetical protein